MDATAREHLHVIGLILYSYMWAKMVAVVLKSGNQQGEDFDEAKLQTARFFNQRLLPYSGIVNLAA
ncbi:acyl-CoA dehydrogenase C-terminal domain-containing protein [Zhongshania aliphaticivorans]|uniref:acyl-CoA dehydrogenase C-terminal domain-containing protein n=1 Tax=Zhongshania aliphaticivorans TaxID=1470434 RepID=UPI0039C8C6D7